MSSSDSVLLLARRFFGFDEPAVKDAQLTRLRKTAPVLERDDTNCPPSVKNQLFTAACALEDARRFEAISFAAWAKNASFERTTNLIRVELRTAIQALAGELSLSSDAADWCIKMVSWSFEWDQLAKFDFTHADLVKGTLGRLSDQVVPEQFCSAVRMARQAFLQELVLQRISLPNFLPNAIFIVEGSTEAILLPHIAECLGHSFARRGVMLLPAGGAKQVGKKYFALRDVVCVPIFCLLDKDAVEQSELIAESLRSCDRLFVIEPGEIEDTFTEKFFVRVLNTYLQSKLAAGQPLSVAELAQASAGAKRTSAAHNILRRRASIDFDKVEFAKLVCDLLADARDIPEELRDIIDKIMHPAALPD